MYVEILQYNMYATERSPDIPGDVTWQWDEQNINFTDWTYRIGYYRSGTTDLGCVIT